MACYEGVVRHCFAATEGGVLSVGQIFQIGRGEGVSWLVWLDFCARSFFCDGVGAHKPRIVCLCVRGFRIVVVRVNHSGFLSSKSVILQQQ